MPSYQVLARKWRPRQFADIIGQEPILRMLVNALNQQRLHHAYLFSGTRGVGKTTLARIIAKCLNCEMAVSATPCGSCQTCQAIDNGCFFDLFEVDAASRTKVEDTRELLENVQYPPAQGRYKVYLIDEVHMLSGHSFNALLKTLEEPPAHAKFLFATTEPKRLPITVLSRCLQFHLKPIAIATLSKHLQKICHEEQITFDPMALDELARAANGSVRDALSLLDQAIVYNQDSLTVENVQQMLGSVPQQNLAALLYALAERNGKKLLVAIKQLAEQAVDFNQALAELMTLLHHISLVQTIADSTPINDLLRSLAAQLSPQDVQLYYQMAVIGRRDLPFTPSPELGFEMTLLRMLAFNLQTNDAPTTATTAKLSRPADPLDTPTTKIAPANQNSQETTSTSVSWQTLLPKLQLTGLAQALATNCTLCKLTDTKAIFSLATHHQPMLTTKLVERIQQALSQHFNRPLTVDIQLTEDNLYTPLKQHLQEQTERLQEATQKITQDQNVKQLIDLFGATVMPDTIRTTD
ncbi:MAG: DNA polymerase III, subunit gamma and tau [Gammaproteobacteria bacterium RIFCSPHIGHO2_12_FULL_41_20]|nr:MAG: DNA polymerase III, subunit gamma and tau [Gammaproteobacteria bacterium RIFCSPHIGHO2_12_FULL_41_20]